MGSSSQTGVRGGNAVPLAQMWGDFEDGLTHAYSDKTMTTPRYMQLYT